MLPWILSFILCVWIFFDARKRRMGSPLRWSLGCFLLLIVFVPLYFAKRNLFPGEVREGGTGWNIVKSFALFWTLFMLAAGISGMIAVSNVTRDTGSGAEHVGATLGAAIGIGAIVSLWFMGLVAALIIGLFLKKGSIVETGPTGALARLETS